MSQEFASNRPHPEPQHQFQIPKTVGTQGAWSSTSKLPTNIPTSSLPAHPNQLPLAPSKRLQLQTEAVIAWAKAEAKKYQPIYDKGTNGDLDSVLESHPGLSRRGYASFLRRSLQLSYDEIARIIGIREGSCRTSVSIFTREAFTELFGAVPKRVGRMIVTALDEYPTLERLQAWATKAEQWIKDPTGTSPPEALHGVEVRHLRAGLIPFLDRRTSLITGRRIVEIESQATPFSLSLSKSDGLLLCTAMTLPAPLESPPRESKVVARFIIGVCDSSTGRVYRLNRSPGQIDQTNRISLEAFKKTSGCSGELGRFLLGMGPLLKDELLGGRSIVHSESKIVSLFPWVTEQRPQHLTIPALLAKRYASISIAITPGMIRYFGTNKHFIGVDIPIFGHSKLATEITPTNPGTHIGHLRVTCFNKTEIHFTTTWYGEVNLTDYAGERLRVREQILNFLRGIREEPPIFSEVTVCAQSNNANPPRLHLGGIDFHLPTTFAHSKVLPGCVLGPRKEPLFGIWIPGSKALTLDSALQLFKLEVVAGREMLLRVDKYGQRIERCPGINTRKKSHVK